MVAGAKRICVWKCEKQAIRTSSARIISWISQKGEFFRSAMEETTGLNAGQAEWHIKELIKKGVIKKTNKKAPKKAGKGKAQAIYKYIGDRN